jgi:alkane 1-monooxygenase
MGAISSFVRRVLLFLPFTLPLWLAPNLPTLTLAQTTRTLLYIAAAFAIPVTMDLIGGASRGEAFADKAAAEPHAEFGFAPRLLAFKFFFIQGLMLYYVWKRHAVGADVVILALLVGLYYGAVGIAIAHELMHRTWRVDRWLGDLLLCMVTYPHFAIEHVYGHHIKVATPDDPASARLGEPLYAFVPRSVIGGLHSAWIIEVRRLKARGYGWLTWRNRMLGYLVLVIGWYAAAWLIAGVYGVVAVVIQSAVAIFSLETINYMQHYGLRRKEIAPGRYERPDIQHSWNWETRFSGLYFLNLGRHSEHHRSAGRRFDALRVLDGQPRLPGGLLPMYLAAMVPPLWFAIMNPRVEALRSGHPGAVVAPPEDAPVEAETPKARRRVQVQSVFDRWGGYLMAGLIVALGLVSSRFGFQNAVLFGIAVAVAIIAFRETFVLLPLEARSE